jgi:4-hydroxybenzoate polyprenyltransferase
MYLMASSSRKLSYRSLAGPYFELARPKQWTKNLLLFAALIFSGEFLHLDACLRSLLALVSFVLLSSAVYTFNDILDLSIDRGHPVKRLRPVASGRVRPEQAACFSAGLAFLGLLLSLSLGTGFLAVCAVYLASSAAYSLWAKHQVILDVFFLSFGFVVRAVAGGLAIGVPISDWLLLCATLLALFLGLAKRRSELTLLKSSAHAHRPALAEYTPALLDQMISVVTGSILLAYALYTVDAHPYRGGHPMMLTIPFVLYGIFRYLYLMHQKGMGGSPELVLLKDRSLQVAVILWAGVCGILLAMEKIYP